MYLGDCAGNLNIYLNLIEVYIESFDYTKAIALLKEILQKNSRIERCYQLLAFCYREINSFEEFKTISRYELFE